MSWTTPKTFTAEVLTSTDMNAQVRDNLNFLKTNIALEVAVELTLDTDGIITKTYSHHTVDTFEDAASDNLVTISGGAEGELLLIRAAHTDRTVVIDTGAGNIVNPSGTDITLNDTNDYCLLAHNGTNWIVIGGGAESDLAAHVAAADPHTGYVLESLYGADSIVAATSDDTPIKVDLAEQTLVGRLTGGHPAAISIGIADDNILQVDQADLADNDFLKATAAGVEGRSYSEVLSDIGALPSIDEDDMASNLATKVPTQQSVKAYVDTSISAIPAGGGGGGSTESLASRALLLPDGYLPYWDIDDGIVRVMPSPTQKWSGFPLLQGFTLKNSLLAVY